MHEIQTGVVVFRALALMLLLAAIAFLFRQEELLTDQRNAAMERAGTEPIFAEEGPRKGG